MSRRFQRTPAILHEEAHIKCRIVGDIHTYVLIVMRLTAKEMDDSLIKKKIAVLQVFSQVINSLICKPFLEARLVLILCFKN